MHQHKIGTRAVVPVLHHYSFVSCKKNFNLLSEERNTKEGSSGMPSVQGHSLTSKADGRHWRTCESGTNQ